MAKKRMIKADPFIPNSEEELIPLYEVDHGLSEQPVQDVDLILDAPTARVWLSTTYMRPVKKYRSVLLKDAGLTDEQAYHSIRLLISALRPNGVLYVPDKYGELQIFNGMEMLEGRPGYLAFRVN